MAKSKLYSNFAIPDSLNTSEKTSIRDLLARSQGLVCQQKRNFEVSNQSFQRCKFNRIHHQDSLPTNASFAHIDLHPKQGQRLIPCHPHHSTQPTLRDPMIQTMIHCQMIPLVMKMMMKCWWNKSNKNHQQQNCRHTM